VGRSNEVGETDPARGESRSRNNGGKAKKGEMKTGSPAHENGSAQSGGPIRRPQKKSKDTSVQRKRVMNLTTQRGREIEKRGPVGTSRKAHNGAKWAM